MASGDFVSCSWCGAPALRAVAGLDMFPGLAIKAVAFCQQHEYEARLTADDWEGTQQGVDLVFCPAPDLPDLLRGMADVFDVDAFVLNHEDSTN